MIEAIRKVGKRILEDFEGESEIKKKEEILKRLEIKPKKDSTKEIKLIFDLDNEKLDIRKGESEFQDKDSTFCFEVAGNDSNIFLGSNNFYYHIKGTIPNLIQKIPDKNSEFKDFLENIRDTFYFKIQVKNKNRLNTEYLLNIQGFIEKELKKFEDEKNNLLEKEKSAKKVEKEMEKINGLLNLFFRAKEGEEIEKEDYDNLTKFFENFYFKNIFDNYSSQNYNLNKIYFKANGTIKDILETESKKDYLDICYHKKVDNFFDPNQKGIKEKKLSPLTNTFETITNDVSFKTKFYTTTNNIYFENISNKNAYKAFTTDKNTFEQLLLGTDYIYKELRFYLNGLNYLLIPKSNNFILNLEKNCMRIKEDMEGLKQKGWEKERKQLKEISLNQENKNWKFDLMFYEKDKSAFNVYKIISDISYFNIKNISEEIGKIDNDSEETVRHVKYFNNGYSFNLNSIWRIHYSWTDLTTFKDKRSIYRTEMLDLLESIFVRRKIKQHREIKKIMQNIRKNYFHKDKNKKPDPREIFKNEFKVNPLVFDTINYLNFLLNLNMMDNKQSNEKRDLFTADISNEDLKEYFDKNGKLFGLEIETGVEKQGLVMLGYFVNKIVYAQRNKSKTFIDKINFDGIKKEDVEKRFVKSVIEYLDLYKKDIYDEPKLFAEMQERLINIKESSLTKEEIVYYILLGNFLGSYIGQKRSSMNEKSEKDKKEENPVP